MVTQITYLERSSCMMRCQVLLQVGAHFKYFRATWTRIGSRTTVDPDVTTVDSSARPTVILTHVRLESVMSRKGLITSAAIMGWWIFIFDADSAVRETFFTDLTVQFQLPWRLMMILRFPAATAPATVATRFRAQVESRVKGTEEGSRTSYKDAVAVTHGATCWRVRWGRVIAVATLRRWGRVDDGFRVVMPPAALFLLLAQAGRRPNAFRLAVTTTAAATTTARLGAKVQRAGLECQLLFHPFCIFNTQTYNC